MFTNAIKTGSVVLALSLLGCLPVASQAAVLLTYDLRATGVGGVAGTKSLDNSKQATVSAAGMTVTMQLWAVIANGNGNTTDDGYLQGHGSFKSSATSGDIKGDIGVSGTNGGGTLAPNYNSAPAIPGNQADLDLDGDQDVGSNSLTSATNYAQISRTTTLFGGNGPSGNPNSPANEYLLETIVFTVTTMGTIDSTVQFIPRVLTTGGSKALHRFTSDGTAYTLEGTATNLAVSLGTGAPVVIHVFQEVPEPGTFALLGLGGLGLLFIRRRFAS